MRAEKILIGTILADRHNILAAALDNSVTGSSLVVTNSTHEAEYDARFSAPNSLKDIAMKKNGHRQVLRRLVWLGLALMFALVSPPPAAAQGDCQWFGTAPLCNGECPSGYSDTGQRLACVTGHKVKCCRIQCGAKQGRNCRLEGKPGGQVCACDEFLKFGVKNDCNVEIEVSVEYEPATNTATGSGAWHTATRRISPGGTVQLFETNNRYVYVSGHSIDGKRVFARDRVDLGKKLPAHHTQSMHCR